MGIISNFKQMVAERVQALQDKNEFLKEVESEAKPIRRAAYMKQIKEQAVNEGRLIAQQAINKRTQKLKPQPESKITKEEADKTVEDQWKVSDPFKYLNKPQNKKNGN